MTGRQRTIRSAVARVFPAEDRAVTAVLGGVLAVALVLALNETASWIREQRRIEQCRIAEVRAYVKLPTEAKVTHYKSWQGVQHHLRFTLPATQSPEAWVERMAWGMGLPRQSRQSRYLWTGEYSGVVYEPATRDFRAHCSRFVVSE